MKNILIIVIVSLLSACSNKPVALSEDGAREFLKGLQIYREGKGCKAFAIAIQDDRYVFGWSYEFFRQDKANKKAIDECESRKPFYGIDKSCELAAVGNIEGLGLKEGLTLDLASVNRNIDFEKFDISQFDITFGILHGDTECDIQAETVEKIPYKIGNKFGFVIEPKTIKAYKYKVVLYMPSDPKTLEGHIVKPTGDIIREGLHSKEFTARGRTVVDGWLTEGDPKGIYKMSLIINDSIAKDVSFLIQ